MYIMEICKASYRAEALWSHLYDSFLAHDGIQRAQPQEYKIMCWENPQLSPNEDSGTRFCDSLWLKYFFLKFSPP